MCGKRSSVQQGRNNQAALTVLPPLSSFAITLRTSYPSPALHAQHRVWHEDGGQHYFPEGYSRAGLTLEGWEAGAGRPGHPQEGAAGKLPPKPVPGLGAGLTVLPPPSCGLGSFATERDRKSRPKGQPTMRSSQRVRGMGARE